MNVAFDTIPRQDSAVERRLLSVARSVPLATTTLSTEISTNPVFSFTLINVMQLKYLTPCSSNGRCWNCSANRREFLVLCTVHCIVCPLMFITGIMHGSASRDSQRSTMGPLNWNHPMVRINLNTVLYLNLVLESVCPTLH